MSAEPSLALQQAIRERLVASAAVGALVPAAHIFDGATRPENFPSIIIGDGQTTLAGQNFTSYRNVNVHSDLHIWAIEDGLALVKDIAGVVWNALGKTLDVPGFDLTNGIAVERSIYMRDPTGKHGHGVLSISALMGCRL